MKLKIGDKVIINSHGDYMVSDYGSKGIIKKIFSNHVEVEFYYLTGHSIINKSRKRTFPIDIRYLNKLAINKDLFGKEV